MKGEERSTANPAGRRRILTIAIVVMVITSGVLLAGVLTIYGADRGMVPGSPSGPVTSSEKDSTSSTVSTVTTPGLSCNESSMLPAPVAQVESSARFGQLSAGLCYYYVGTLTGSQDGTNYTQYEFDYYNGTVYYPCGTSPSELIVSQIQAVELQSPAASENLTLSLDNDTSSLNRYSCPADTPPVGIVSVDVVYVTIPAVPELNVTLTTQFASQPVAAVTSVLETSGINYTMVFTQASASHPLGRGAEVSQLELIGALGSMASGGVYTMLIVGRYSDGQSFSYNLEAAVVEG